MNKFLTLISFFLLLSCTTTESYYIDSENGSDAYAGNSPETAWKSLDPVNSRLFKAGDRVLFKAGSIFHGPLELKGNGNEHHPIVVDQYGEGVKPVIHGDGIKEYAMLLKNGAYWEINNLEFTNQGTTDQPGRRGVIVHASDFGECRHIHLKRLVVHNVNGSLVKNEGGGTGIYWCNEGDSVPTRFVDLRIEDCHIYDCQRDGITSRGNGSRDKWYPSLQVVIRNNLIEKVPGDGIVPIACDGALVEYNTVRNSPDLLRIEDAAAGIWPFSSDNTVIQYNEVSGQSAKWDGQGFDSDYNCRNTLIQYNYSHDNAGGFVMVCNEGNTLGEPYNIGTENTIIRYNISVNDGLRSYPTRPGWFSPTIHLSGPSKNTKIYNNVIVVKKKPLADIDRTILKVDNWGGPWPEDVLFANNIFYVADDTCSYDFDAGSAKNIRFTHNLFYGNFSNLPEDLHALFEDPQFQHPILSHIKGDVEKSLRLKSGSPCIGAGMQVEKNENEPEMPANSPKLNIGVY